MAGILESYDEVSVFQWNCAYGLWSYKCFSDSHSCLGGIEWLEGADKSALG